MAGGWTGKYLYVDLTAGTVEKRDLDLAVAEKYIGQRGLGSKMVSDFIPDPTTDALDPANPIIILNGPLTGLYGICNGRFEVCTKSPLTGCMAGSNSGGFWGPELKYAGYDGIVFVGKSEKPVYLWVNDAEVKICDAKDVWGKDTYETTHHLRHVTDEEAKVLCIGPAGEKLSRIAAVMNDMYRAAARSGVGAVFGSKNLKGVVVRGTGELTAAEPFKYFKRVKDSLKDMVEAGDSGGALTELGTACLVNPVNESGAMSYCNWGPESGAHPDYEKVSGENLKEKQLIKNKACFGCPISCGRVSKVTTGKYKTPQSEGPEYETIWGFSANCGCFDMDAVIKANYECNAMGVDTISMAGTISCAMELYSKGYITREEAGIDLSFGNAETMVELVRQTGLREGIGDKLAEGSYRLAESYGHPECSITVKKQEFPGYEPRAGQGVGLCYATSNRGACHVRGNLTDPELTVHMIEQDITDGKAAFVVSQQELGTIFDCVGMCTFPQFTVTPVEVAELLKYATGVPWTAESLVKAAERVWNFEKLFNLKAGIKPEEDTLPERILKVPLGTGSQKGKVNQLDVMLPEYYSVRGWGTNGIPTADKIKELNLEDETKVL
jgi:aldehyde:ferredoxin oxidoreductase